MRLLAFLSLLLAFRLSSGQEKIFDLTNSDHDIPYEATLVEDRLFFSISTFDGFPTGQVYDSYLLVLDMQMNLVDSVSMNANTGLARSGIVSIETWQDSLAAVCVTEGSWQKYTRENRVMFYDKNLNLTDSVHINSDAPGTFLQSYRLSNIYDSLLIVSNLRQDTAIDSVYYPHISIINDQQVVVKEKSYKNVGHDLGLLEYEAFGQFSFFNGRYVTHTSWPFTFLPIILFDSKFEYDTAYQNIDFTPELSYNIDRYLHSSNSKFYTAGYTLPFNGRYSYGIVTFNSNFTIGSLDTIILDDRVVDQEGCIDFNDLNNIIFAVSEASDNVIGGVNICIASMDTSGTVNWRRKIFQDSAVFFVVHDVEATPDGGAFIVSQKLDLRPNANQVGQTASIIKIDSLGQVVGEREWKLPPSFSLYPNPASEFVQLQGIAAHEKVQVNIYDSNGRLVDENYLGLMRTMDVSALPPGTYILSLAGEKSRYRTQKLVVE